MNDNESHKNNLIVDDHLIRDLHDSFIPFPSLHQPQAMPCSCTFLTTMTTNKNSNY